jgi:small subunit ribosomal protein S6
LDVETKKLYEAMFLVDAAAAASDWDGLEESVRKILSRNQAEVVSLKKWDERRLAYDVQGKSRGTYILCYFHSDGGGVAGIEKDVRLSEKVMRVLILRVVPGMVESDERKVSPEPVAATEPEKAGPKEKPGSMGEEK